MIRQRNSPLGSIEKYLEIRMRDAVGCEVVGSVVAHFKCGAPERRQQVRRRRRTEADAFYSQIRERSNAGRRAAARTFSGPGIAAASRPISPSSAMNGTKMQSAPASRYAFARAIVS